jgi:ATP-dependent Clp protease ATP-binding subunit ClpA
MAQFDKFTERARKVLLLAQEEAQRFNHNYIGTEHLLLGLVREGDGVAARVLNNMGVQLPKVRSAVEFIIGRGEGAVIGDIGLTPRAKKVLELAVDEGRRLNHHYINTEHLLLGLVREEEGIAAGVLETLGVNLENVRLHVMSVVDNQPLDLHAPPPFRPIGHGPGVETLGRGSLAMLVRAFNEAATMGYAEVDTGHLLIALLSGKNEGEPGDNDELARRIAEFRQTMREIYPPPDNPDLSALALNRDARSVLERASYEARTRAAPLVEPEHILLAITLSAGSLAERLNQQLEQLIHVIRRRTSQDPESQTPGSTAPETGDPEG